MSVKDTIAKRIGAATNTARAGGDPAAPKEAPKTDAGASAEPAPAAAPAAAQGEQQTPANVVEQAGGAPAQVSDDELKAQERQARRARIEADLAATREKRRAEAERQKAEADRKEAERLKQEALSEKQKYDALRTGSFKETLEALGRDPRAVFQEMQREAIEAGTPEGQIRKMRADFEKQMGEKLAPLEQTINELKAENERLKQERAQNAEQALHAQVESDFVREVQDPAFRDLRVEYEDGDLFAYVQAFVRNPKSMYAAARDYDVRLTDPSKGFTMREMLLVLKAAQDRHTQGKQERAARFGAQPADAAPSAAAPSAKPLTVNGTAERRNAGQTIDPDVAKERASPSRRLSRAERVQREIDRLSGR